MAAGRASKVAYPGKQRARIRLLDDNDSIIARILILQA